MVPMLVKVAKTFAARGLTGTALVVLTYFVARRHGVESAGFVNLVWSILLLVAMVARYGIEYSGVRNLAVHAQARSHADAAAFINASAGLLLVLLLVCVPFTLQISSRLFADYAVTTRDLLTFALILVAFGLLSFLAPLHRGLSQPDASYYYDQGGVAILLLLMLAVGVGDGAFVQRFLFVLLVATSLLTFASWWHFRHSYRQHFARAPQFAPRSALAATLRTITLGHQSNCPTCLKVMKILRNLIGTAGYTVPKAVR
jgi:O-antigen/teichoic acid export membrane protein